MLFFETIAQAIRSVLLAGSALTPPDAGVLAERGDGEDVEEGVTRRKVACSTHGGRLWGYVATTSDPDVCVRWSAGGPGRPDLPDCQYVAIHVLHCESVVTVPPPGSDT